MHMDIKLFDFIASGYIFWLENMFYNYNVKLKVKFINDKDSNTKLVPR